MRTARVRLRLGPRCATLTSWCPWRGACVRWHSLEWGPQKPITIPGSQLCSWNTCRELYRQVSNFVGSVLSPILSNIYMDRLDRYVQETLIPEYMQGKSRAVNPAYWRIQSLALRYKKTGNIERS